MNEPGAKATLVIYESRVRKMIVPNQRFRWRLVAPNGRKIANGGEGYGDSTACKGMAKRILGGEYADAHIVEKNLGPKS